MGEFYCCHTHATALTPSYSFWTALTPANSQMVSMVSRSNNYCSERSLQDICNAPKSPVWAEPDFWHLCLGLPWPVATSKHHGQLFKLGGTFLSAVGLENKSRLIGSSSLMEDRNWNDTKAVRFFKFTILFHEPMAKT